MNHPIWTQICPKHVEIDWWNNLRINSASSWFLLHRHNVRIKNKHKTKPLIHTNKTVMCNMIHFYL
jgi:hypothetical protein